MAVLILRRFSLAAAVLIVCLRSYHISSEKIRRELGFVPKRTIEDAVRDLCRAFTDGRIPEPIDGLRYHNVKAIQAAGLT